MQNDRPLLHNYTYNYLIFILCTECLLPARRTNSAQVTRNTQMAEQACRSWRDTNHTLDVVRSRGGGGTVFTQHNSWQLQAVKNCLMFTLYLLTYSLNLLTPYSTVLVEKLTGFQLVKKFPAFYGTRRFITAVRCSHPQVKKAIIFI
jgi:hypothetical protein